MMPWVCPNEMLVSASSFFDLIQSMTVDDWHKRCVVREEFRFRSGHERLSFLERERDGQHLQLDDHVSRFRVGQTS